MNQYIKQDTMISRYIQIPEFVLRVKISEPAKLLYGVLYDRTRLSQKNADTWTDAMGNVFVVYPYAELSKRLGKSPGSIKAALKQLEKADLIERRHVGYGVGRATHIYIRIPLEYGQESNPTWTKSCPRYGLETTQ